MDVDWRDTGVHVRVHDHLRRTKAGRGGCGQILFSLAVDHYGFLLPEATPLSPIRIAGAVLLVISVAMIMAPKF
jgi:hypothetical protein